MKHNSARLTAAGALARDLLYRNGHRYYPECDSVVGRPSPASVSLVEPLTSGIRVYPNPANKFVTLERNGSVSEINVRFVQLGTGRVCLERTLLVTEPSITVDLTFLAAGIYAIIFQGARESGQVKLVVSH